MGLLTTRQDPGTVGGWTFEPNLVKMDASNIGAIGLRHDEQFLRSELPRNPPQPLHSYSHDGAVHRSCSQVLL
ncbi:hypothetical protein GOP47_0011400 [Adiantum capillus-veneris]|uniref:Uncharacterized protein n=1 Tax=Adiantum capillus-veneris TaxID=13818 RepID=A0A9D4ZGP8_ADICA|nr:hypothetical protein GOP47_0011400 [Adiantum capillus-veneris]